MQIVFSLSLPRDSATVPVVRSLARTSMKKLGVTEDCADDIEIALTEACTNVLRHALSDDDYEVEMELNELAAHIRVMDTGRGFDHEALAAEAVHSSEGGRGIMLMRALVDNVSFESRPEAGVVVNLVKRLSLHPDSVLLHPPRGQGRSKDMASGVATPTRGG